MYSYSLLLLRDGGASVGLSLGASSSTLLESRKEPTQVHRSAAMQQHSGIMGSSTPSSKSIRVYLLGVASGMAIQHWIAATMMGSFGLFLPQQQQQHQPHPAIISSASYNHHLAAATVGRGRSEQRSRGLEQSSVPADQKKKSSPVVEVGPEETTTTKQQQHRQDSLKQSLPPPPPPPPPPPIQAREEAPEPPQGGGGAAAAGRPRKTFKYFLVASGSDKYPRHHYERYYESWLRPYRAREGLKFLEIGARHGHSLQLWEDYFDQPELIVGLAYAVKNATHLAEKLPGLPHVQVHWGDQSSPETMDRLRNVGPWDIVVDDGSHVPQHMVYSLYELWQSVKPGGLYIIEDLETNYWPDGIECQGYPLNGTGIGAGPEFSAVAKLEQIQQVLVRHQIGATALSVMPGDHDLCSVEWGMNLVALRKCESPLTYAKPRYFNPKFDADRMDRWIREARRTNPPPYDRDFDAAAPAVVQ